MATSTTTTIASYVQLAKGAKGAAAAALARQATQQAGLFTFAELLLCRGIAELEGGEHHSAVALLKLFSYGTYADWRDNKGAYPELDASQLNKLKQLTLVTLAETNKQLAYDATLQLLDVPNVRVLEDLVIDAVYQGIIRARLDQRARAIEVEHTIGRDLRPGELDDIIDCLDHWAGRAGRAIDLIDENMRRIGQYSAQYEKEREAHDADVEKSKARGNKRPDTSDSGAAGDFSSHEYFEEEGRSRSGAASGSTGKKVPKNSSSSSASSSRRGNR